MIDKNGARFGEILQFERRKLYDWIYKFAPANILEVGTGFGGSTYCMAEAIKDLNVDAKIYTCDPRRHPERVFFTIYPFVTYHKATSELLIKVLAERRIDIDFIFFDGPADPNVALNDIKTLEQYIKKGVHFSMHDWETTPRGHDGATSTKSLLIRPYIEASKRWKEVEVLSGLKKNDEKSEEAFDSVGLCLYQFKG